jgi:hypothetical protein
MEEGSTAHLPAHRETMSSTMHRPQCLNSASTMSCDTPLGCRVDAWECRLMRFTSSAGPVTKPIRTPDDRTWRATQRRQPQQGGSDTATSPTTDLGERVKAQHASVHVHAEQAWRGVAVLHTRTRTHKATPPAVGRDCSDHQRVENEKRQRELGVQSQIYTVHTNSVPAGSNTGRPQG